MTSHENHEAPHSHAHENHEGAYFMVFIALALLTLAELLVTYVPVIKIPLLAGLATAKAMLVIAFYMHLRWEKRIYPAFFTFPVIVAILTALAIQQLVV
jgi:caa(3)-type oxidase subunit IV